MIKEISFLNYRVFASQQTLELAPLTVLFGKNNSGKSAVLKLPLLLESALNCPSNEVFVKNFNEVILCDELRDIVYNKGNRAVAISVSSKEGDLLNFSFYVDMASRQKKTHIESWMLSDSHGQSITFISDEEGQLVDEDKKVIIFNGIVPQNINEDWIFEALSHFKTTNDYITHVRTLPSRDYRVSEVSHELMGLHGEHAYDFLVRDVVERDGSLLSKVSSWYEKVFDGWKINIDQTRSPAYSIELQNQNVKNNILDTGAGIGQSLPEIIAVSRKCNSAWQLILEEPETHLHPVAHAEMAEYMAKEVLSDRNKQVMVETHSLSFILRLRTMIANGELDKNDLALYYVRYDPESGASTLERIIVNSDGSVNMWPDVFNESYKEAVLLHNAQKNRKQ